MTPVSISVVVPTFERSAASAASVAEQAAGLAASARIEVIVVDDASSPVFAAEVRALESRWNCVRTVRMKDNVGPGAARNVGIAAARGDWIIFADSDDSICLAAWIDTIGSGAFVRPDVIAGPFLITIQGVPWATWGGNNCVGRGDLLYKLTLRRAAVWRYAFRREYLIDSGIRFPALRFGEDLLFILRLANSEPVLWVSGGRPVYEYQTVAAPRHPTTADVALLQRELEELRRQSVGSLREAVVTSWLLRVAPGTRKWLGLGCVREWKVGGASTSKQSVFHDLRTMGPIVGPMVRALANDPPVSLARFWGRRRRRGGRVA